MSEQQIGRNCPIRNVTTGKVYRNIHYACMDLGIRPKTLYKYMSMGQAVNGHRFERIEMEDRLQARKQATNPELFMQLNMVKFPPSLQVGDYVISKGDRVLIYGSLESLTTRCDLRQANILISAKNGLRDRLGRRVTFVDSEETLQTICGGDSDWVEVIRQRERNKIRIGGLR